MKRVKSVFPIFLLFLILSTIIFFFFQAPLTQPLQQITLPVQKWAFTTLAPVNASQSNLEKLQQENDELRKQLAKTKEMERDNKALRDQFELSDPDPKDLLPASVIGMSDDTIIIDKGAVDQVTVGDVVVVKDNLVGKISKVSPRISVVQVISHPSTSFTAEAVKSTAIGVIKATGGDSIYLDNVILSDTLEKNDIVQTKGDVDASGAGYPPELIVGKIESVSKQDSNLFQQAKVKSLIDFSKLRMVFVITE